MKLVKKILVVHGDAKVRRRLVLLFADAGFDLRAFATADAAVENAQGEWYDLAVVDHELSDAPGFVLVDRLKKIQPTVPVLLLVARLELPLVVKGIRVGVADVLPATEEPRVTLRRARALLRLDNPPDADGVTLEELTQVESALDGMNRGANSGHSFSLPLPHAGADLLHLSKENAALQERTARLLHEKGALEAELKTLLTQNSDAVRLQSELTALHSERELAAATQLAIDEKARALAETRAALASERSALEEARRRAAPAAVPPEDEHRRRGELAAAAGRLAEEQERIREQAQQVRAEATRLAQERRRWHEELDVFRTQEENLRAYEERLRKLQAELEADRVLWFSANNRPPSHSPFTDDAALREAWAKLQRATELLEIERTNFRDDRLAVQEHHAAVKRREEQVRDREIRLSLREKKLSSLPPVPAPAAAVSAEEEEEPSAAVEAMKSLTRAPMEIARAVFGGGRKS